MDPRLEGLPVGLDLHGRSRVAGGDDIFEP
jgi:hypothetical protein